jgi:multidrug efflux pump subunit AcrA (membrane-fusion protein)
VRLTRGSWCSPATGAGRLAEGLPAEVEIDARPGVVYVAEVGHVDTLAQPRHPKVPVNYFGVTLELERTDATTMRVGQRVRATILVTERDVVVVPREAVFDRDGRSLVYRLAGDAFEPVEVTLGSASAGRVVITSGIEPGDHIALRDPTRPADPDRQPGEDAADAAGPRAKPGAAG